MIKTNRLMSIALVWLCAASAYVQDTAPAVAASSAPKSPNIQFGIPTSITLAQVRKEAHQKVDTLDKMTPAEWDKGQKDFHAQMERISKLPPEEQKRLFPGVPPEILSHMGRVGMPQQGAPTLTPEQSLARARKNAHARADEYDKMTEQEWAERVQRNQDAVQKYKALKEEQEKRGMLNKLLNERAPGGTTPTLGQSKIPPDKLNPAPQ